MTPAVSKDIVQRLLTFVPVESGELYEVLFEAAAEIEWLRAELEEAYDACRYALADSPRWQENCATVVASMEARRG